MGLLDNLFFGSNADFGGQQGGLLDFLKTSLDQNNKYQPNDAGLPPIPPPATFADRFNAVPNAPQPFNPSERAFGTAQFDPSTYAPNQAQPIPVGNNYQMPRIGSADQYAPQATGQAALPPNAQPTQGQLPNIPAQGQIPTQQPQQGQLPPQPSQAQPGAPQQLPPALGGNALTNPILRAIQSVGRGGGLVSALSGNYNDPQSVQQQNLKAQFDATRHALIANGVSASQANSTAMLAVMNPEAAKTILPELLTNKEKYGVTSEDPLTGKHYGFINEREQTINGKPLGQGGEATGQSTGLQAMTDNITQMRTQGATRDQMLAQIPTGFRDDVASLLSGKAVPANMGRAQSRMALLTLAKTVDPNFDEQMIPTRIAMRKDFSGEGKNGQSIGSFNTAQHHIDKLSDDLETVAKFQGNYPTINAIRGGLANGTNSNPELRDALQSLNTDMAAVSHEVGNAYNAGHLSDHDMSTWNALTNSNLPPDQLRRGIADFVDLLNGKRDSLNNMYRQQFGEDAPSIEKEKNAAVTAKVHQRSPQYGGAASSGLPSGWSVKAH